MLLPPSLDDWLPQDHMARFIDEAIDAMDIKAIADHYERELRGYPPYHPRMMLKILIYGYCNDVRASRKLAKRCVEDVAFRYLAANNFPDFRTISDFRQMHLTAFKELFLQTLMLCKKAGLCTLGHIALDGSKIKAHASKHKAMSYGRMKAEEERLKREIEQLVAQAQKIDREEDEKYGKDKSGDEVPDEMKRKEDRLKRIQEAKAALEEEAAKKNKGDKDDKGDPPKPDDKTQRNFTDPESGIMPSSSDKKSFIQGYNGQIAVNEHQIIIANGLTSSSADCPQLIPMTAKVRANAGGLPEAFTADAGYFSKANVLFLREFLKINALIPPDRQRHGQSPQAPETGTGSLADLMRALLATEDNKAIYALRKVLAEPVFGQIKRCMGFTQFLVRGEAKASGEWDLVCLCQNLRKLFGHQMKPAKA